MKLINLKKKENLLNYYQYFITFGSLIFYIIYGWQGALLFSLIIFLCATLYLIINIFHIFLKPKTKKESVKTLKQEDTFKIDIDSILVKVNNAENSPEILIKSLFLNKEIDRDELISKIKINFMSIILETFTIILNYSNNQEYELNRYLTIKKKKHFIIWSIAYIILIFIILSINFILILNVILFDYYISLFFLTFFMYLANDFKRKMNKTFEMGYYHYVKNKKLFNECQRTLNLICNNSYIRMLEDFNDINKYIGLFNLKIVYYSTLLNPYYNYLKKFEIYGILGLILPFIYFLLQNIFLQVSIKVYYSILLVIILFTFCFFLPSVLISRFEQRFEKFKKQFKKFQNLIYKKLDILKSYHYAFILIDSSEI